jgi:hypothetical protein
MRCECTECRALAEEISANAEALSALRGEELPALAVKAPRRTPVYPWIAVAAALLMAILTGVKHQAPTAPVRFSEPLKIKMLTPDPDVVIYWLVDSKKEEQR